MMKHTEKKHHRQAGFTLIEVIATIILAALLGTAMFTYMYSSSMTDSPTAVDLTRGEAKIERIMEQIVLDYITNANTGGDPATALSTLKTKIDNGDYDIDGNDARYVTPTDAYLTGPTGSPSVVVEVEDPGGHTVAALFTASRLNGTDPLIFH